MAAERPKWWSPKPRTAVLAERQQQFTGLELRVAVENVRKFGTEIHCYIKLRFVDVITQACNWALEEIVAAPVKKTENSTGGIRCADHATPPIRKSWNYVAKKRRSLGRHSSLADQSHGGGKV
jgi:hypothetical protein